jgi:hypothetical protein
VGCAESFDCRAIKRRERPCCFRATTRAKPTINTGRFQPDITFARENFRPEAAREAALSFLRKKEDEKFTRKKFLIVLNEQNTLHFS